jgi:hypothetical protein
MKPDQATVRDGSAGTRGQASRSQILNEDVQRPECYGSLCCVDERSVA